MADRDKGATVRLIATIARSRYEADGGTLIEGIHLETILDMALAAKREVDSLRADLARVTAERDEARCGRDARVPLASLPTEYVCGEWIMAGQAEPDAVVTYASDPSPETGHVGWCWWARGKMGESRDYVAARDAAEKALRAHAAGSGGGGTNG